ncbi:MAG: hypothetical protein NC408_04995 [Candidatus Gastranaerophilales bacterium]|nr:hypothetical protein [Candidatus Gastranaerophilales bacterium]MCM1072307.1 hypothetical protein [Bacteroides sp.]
MRKQVIAYLHTHWDREWYREFEVFRMRLLRVFDNVLDMLDTNKIPCFYFDGQVSALEDYLEIRPEKEALVRTLIAQKKLFIGPFYCLVDEFLTDKTCFEKNLEIGMKKAIDFGCTNFIGYLPDTFGHSENVVDILREFGLDKCIVWRGCGDFPANFKWNGMDTVNLIRGYFNDVFALKCSVEEKAEILKKTLDAISEKSGQYMLLPIGADHLGVPADIQDQILAVNEILKEDYNIKLGSPFDYFRYAHGFDEFEYNGELRDNSKTFVLQGCYSSRLDLKRLNTECCHKLELASRFIKYAKSEKKYNSLLNYAYKMLIQNQAHDSICGCSLDDVHSENIIRYKKILQIADTIVDELKFETNFEDKMVLNLSNKQFSGIIEFESTKPLKGFQKVSSRRGFDKNLLTDTQRIPVTEDYTEINTYLAEVEDLQPNEISFIDVDFEDSDLEVTENSLSNSKIRFHIEKGLMYINDIPISLVDFADLGDSYNNGPKEDDSGTVLKIYRTKIYMEDKKRSALKIDFEGQWDIVSLILSLDKGADFLKFDFDWVNTQKNHLLEVKFDLPEPIYEVFSEDMNTIIKREFNPDYDIRKNLPKTRGLEAKTNSAPMQRGFLIDETRNNLGIVTKGLTQYEVFKNSLYLPILRATGVISNPKNPARSTPAGPPLETPTLQMQGENKAEFCVFFGNRNAFEDVLNKVYNFIIA